MIEMKPGSALAFFRTEQRRQATHFSGVGIQIQRPDMDVRFNETEIVGGVLRRGWVAVEGETPWVTGGTPAPLRSRTLGPLRSGTLGQLGLLFDYSQVIHSAARFVCKQIQTLPNGSL